MTGSRPANRRDRTSEELIAVTETQTQVTWLTQEAHDRLKNELDELVAQRPAIAQKINAAREEGDLKENGGYHAAREEQGVMEARIRHLQELLHTAKVGYKFAAEMQHAQGCANPVMIRIETRAGHGAGKPVWMQIEDIADQFGFVANALGVPAPAG